jgi:hypothetical protein
MNNMKAGCCPFIAQLETYAVLSKIGAYKNSTFAR